MGNLSVIHHHSNGLRVTMMINTPLSHLVYQTVFMDQIQGEVVAINPQSTKDEECREMRSLGWT